LSLWHILLYNICFDIWVKEKLGQSSFHTKMTSWRLAPGLFVIWMDGNIYSCELHSCWYYCRYNLFFLGRIHVHKYMRRYRLTYRATTGDMPWERSFARVALSCCGTSIVSSHVFVYIACIFRRCIPRHKCEHAPRILARISINCVYEVMVRCWNDEWERCSNVECPLDSVECIKLIEKRVWSGAGHLPVSYAGRAVLYPVHS
jgi:hypothetical protein